MMQLKFMFCLFVVEAMAIVPVAVVVSTFAAHYVYSLCDHEKWIAMLYL